MSDAEETLERVIHRGRSLLLTQFILFTQTKGIVFADSKIGKPPEAKTIEEVFELRNKFLERLEK